MTSVLKMLPSAYGLGQYFQDLGHSFSPYGPPSRQITYIYLPSSIGLHIGRRQADSKYHNVDQSLPDSIFQSALIHWHQWNKKSNLLWLSTLFLPLQARRFFYMIIKYLGKLKSIFFRQQREVSRVRPSLKNANLPEPI